MDSAIAGALAQQSFVLDTSVLLSDPKAFLRFAEHEVILPVVVISELEKKRHDAELGYFARSALRLLDELRVKHGALNRPIPLNDQGGQLLIELNHISLEVLPHGFRGSDNDARILAVAKNFADEGREVTVVSKDLPMRVKASAMGLAADEYRNEWVTDSGWTGLAEVSASSEQISQLYDGEKIDLEDAEDLPVNTGLVISSDRGSALGRVKQNAASQKYVQVVRGDREVFGLHGRSAEQRLAIDMLMDPELGIVSMGGRAGTGKSALALCAGLEAVLERGEHKKIIVFRPLYAVGGQELGYLPGSEAEKMNPWGQAVFDTLGALVSENALDEVMHRGLLEVLPLTHIRGRSLHDAWVIVDEAQSLEKNVLLTVMSRMGQNSKIVLTHDVAQRDNLRVGRHDGIAAVVEILKGNPLFGHVTLTRSERSRIAALVTELLEDA
ncbi:PhoH family protein [Nesterenkonia sp. LB17]|uniref:PhoH family protein n=1 Tax=unclassified Nesterenkonia TaxID=2629769 RepID=UPI001F4D2F8D|nr:MULTISPECIES: PhoH family protein [unclassified Nesterenkonia]MCH8560203.1 PhoH family protein [Nesterenkonia sp. DZ6]MCH8563793.1 PhoH family protein [Nesterenkonia sp. YGD6]MCH8565584.1 PhoH family protein [Nesterenkonia sp. LB17]